MKTELFLHIGRPKAGSTALQNFLHDNRSALLQRGLLYPRSPMFNGASHKLALVFQPELPDAKCVAERSAAQVYSELFTEVESAGVRRMVASSENLFLVDPNLPRDLLAEVADTKIVCYVRRQDEVLVSSLLQEMQMGDIDEDVDVEKYAFDQARLRWLDYSTVLDRWSAAFGHSNIVVRVLERGQMQGTIEEDFMSILGISMAGLKQPTGRANPSPARDVLDVIKMIGATSSGSGLLVRQLMQRSLLEASEKIGAKGRFDARALVPAAIRRRVLEHFRASNAEVARKYLGKKDGVLFSNEKIEAPDSSTGYSGLDLERFAVMATTLLADQQRQILKLHAQLNALQRKLQP
jgi:hypothetical protein